MCAPWLCLICFPSCSIHSDSIHLWFSSSVLKTMSSCCGVMTSEWCSAKWCEIDEALQDRIHCTREGSWIHLIKSAMLIVDIQLFCNKKCCALPRLLRISCFAPLTVMCTFMGLIRSVPLFVFTLFILRVQIIHLCKHYFDKNIDTSTAISFLKGAWAVDALEYFQVLSDLYHAFPLLCISCDSHFSSFVCVRVHTCMLCEYMTICVSVCSSIDVRIIGCACVCMRAYAFVCMRACTYFFRFPFILLILLIRLCPFILSPQHAASTKSFALSSPDDLLACFPFLPFSCPSLLPCPIPILHFPEDLFSSFLSLSTLIGCCASFRFWGADVDSFCIFLNSSAHSPRFLFEF